MNSHLLLPLITVLDSELREKIDRIFDNHESRLNNGVTQAQVIATVSAHLTALIPDYITATYTVISLVYRDLRLIEWYAVSVSPRGEKGV
jgi:hypothetical protein